MLLEFSIRIELFSFYVVRLTKRNLMKFDTEFLVSKLIEKSGKFFVPYWKLKHFFYTAIDFAIMYGSSFQGILIH
jgi:hypothetical protein